MKLSVIIPSYNEIENIDNLITAIVNVLSKVEYEVVVVDDNSPDGSWKVVQRHAEQNPHVKLVRRIGERGLRSAIQTGIKASTGEAVAWMDCDFQHPPEKLLELKMAIEAGVDVASASRFLDLRGGTSGDSRLDSKDGPFIVRFHGFLSRLLNKTITLICRSRLTDWTSGMVCMRKSVVDRLLFRGNHGEYLMYLLFQADHGQFSIKEIPYVLRLREAGLSKSSTTYSDLFILGLKYIRVVSRLAYFTYIKNPFKIRPVSTLEGSVSGRNRVNTSENKSICEEPIGKNI